MWVQRFLYMVFLVILLFAPAAARADFPLPSDLETITPVNANQIEAIATIGRGGIHDALWTPDGERVIVESSVGVWIYNAETFERPQLLPDTAQIEAMTVSDDSSLLAMVKTTSFSQNTRCSSLYGRLQQASDSINGSSNLWHKSSGV